MCEKNIEHAEAVQVIFDPKKTSYEAIIAHFFTIHNASEKDRQGPEEVHQKYYKKNGQQPYY